MTKYYLSLYYGININLPDKLFYAKINEINKLCDDYAEKINNRISVSNS